MTEELSAKVREALEALAVRLEEDAPGVVSSLVVYGSAARGDHDARRSDVNLLVVLKDTGAEALKRVAPALRKAFRTARVRPYVTREGELHRLADVFPVKVLDMQRHHVMVRGADPFEGVTVEPAHLRLRVEQELRNHLLRLRWQYVHLGDDPTGLVALLRRTALSLRTELWALLVAAQKEPAGADLGSVFHAAVESFDLSRGTLDGLNELVTVGAEDVAGLADQVVGLLEQAVAVADELETP